MEKIKMSFRKEEFDIIYHFHYCEESENKFTTTALDELNTLQVYNLYREKYNLPFPEDLRRIREKYDLSQRRMSKVLGLGINSYGAYEKGEVPSASIGNLILLADDPKSFKRIVHQSSDLDKEAKDKLRRKIDRWIIYEKEKRFESEFEYYLFDGEVPEEYSGFKRSSLTKMIEMVAFFAKELQPWKTKLNKLLFYADFELYRQTGYSMSGSRYRAIPYGPAPYKYQSLFEYMVDNDIVNINYQEFSNGEGEQFLPSQNKAFNPEFFSEVELNVLSQVVNKFKDTTTKEIIDISHNELGWKKNKDQAHLISYKYAFYLKGASGT